MEAAIILSRCDAWNQGMLQQAAQHDCCCITRCATCTQFLYLIATLRPRRAFDHQIQNSYWAASRQLSLHSKQGLTASRLIP